MHNVQDAQYAPMLGGVFGIGAPQRSKGVPNVRVMDTIKGSRR